MYLLKYSMLKPGRRLAAWEGDATKAGRMKTALSGYERTDEEPTKEGSRMTALCECRKGDGSKRDRVEKSRIGAES